EGAGRACVISYRLWQERFGGQLDVVGRSVLLNTDRFQIAGVTERGFTGVTLHETHDLQIPSSAGARVLGGNRASFALAELVARLKSGIPSSQAQARLDVIGKQIQKAIGPKMSGRNAFLLRDGSQGIGSKKEQFGKPVVLLLLLVAVVLLVACANLAALLL